MKLPFNPVRLIVLSLSTLLIVGSVTWYANSIRHMAKKFQVNQPPMKPENPSNSSPSSDSTSPEISRPPTTPEIQEPTMPTTADEDSETSGFSRELRNSLLPKNAIPWKLKPVEGLKNPEWIKPPDDWQTFSLAESRELIRHYLEAPDRYYGKFDLQEDLSQWSSPAAREPDWTTLPWEELRRRYILRYPNQAKPLIREGEKFTQQLSPQYLQILDRTRYRLVNLE